MAARKSGAQRTLGIGRNILTRRLNALVDDGLMRRVEYQQHPPRHEYHFTAAGRELFPVMLALTGWGDRWAVDTPALLPYGTVSESSISRVLASSGGHRQVKSINEHAHVRELI